MELINLWTFLIVCPLVFIAGSIDSIAGFQGGARLSLLVDDGISKIVMPFLMPVFHWHNLNGKDPIQTVISFYP